MLQRAGFGLSTILAISLVSLANSHVFAEEPCEKQESKKGSLVERVVGIQEAQAMPIAPMPAPPTTRIALEKQDMNFSFKDYVNNISDSKFSEKNPTREDFEKISIYRTYYAVEDKKDKFEENITRPINESKWKDRAGIDKISTKFSDEYVRLQVRLKEKKERPKSILGKLLQTTVGKVDKIVGKADYGADMVELRAINEF